MIKYGKKLSLTKNSQKVLKDDFELFKLLFDTFRNKFNWGYFDGFEDRPIGPLGFGFTLILLSKYGGKPRSDVFYAEKYLKAFPALLDGIPESPGRAHAFVVYSYVPRNTYNGSYRGYAERQLAAMASLRLGLVEVQA